jgi:hypothetical protein
MEIAPPLHCDHCASHVEMLGIRYPAYAESELLRFRIPDAAQPRILVWLCPDCLAIADRAGLEVTPQWRWPGARRPRATRKHPSLDPVAHAAAIASVTELPVRGRPRAYALAYLEHISNPEAWISAGLRLADRWAPANEIVDARTAGTLNTLWRWYAKVWWSQKRRAEEVHQLERPMDEKPLILTLSSQPDRIPARRRQSALPVAPNPPRPAMTPLDQERVLEKIDAALDAFDADILAWQERMAAFEKRRASNREEK